MTDAGPIPLAKDIATGVIATSLLFAAAAAVPVLGIAAAALVPMPVIYYRGKQGRGAATAIVMGTLMILWATIAMTAGDLLMVSGLLTLGAALSEMLHRPVSLERLMVRVCAAVSSVVLLAVLAASALTGQGVTALVAAHVTQSLDMWLHYYAQSGADSADLAQVTAALEQLGQVLTWLMPAMILSTTLVITWVNVLMARAVYRWRQQAFPDFGPLDRWSAPEPMVWAAIVSGLLMVLPLGTPLAVIGGNAALVVTTVYFLNGVAIVHYFMEKKQIPRALRAITYSLLVFQTLLALLVAGLGLFDLWLDLRKLKTNGSG